MLRYILIRDSLEVSRVHLAGTIGNVQDHLKIRDRVIHVVDGCFP